MLKVIVVGIVVGYICYRLKLPAMSPGVREGVVGIAALYFGYFELPKVLSWLLQKIA